MNGSSSGKGKGSSGGEPACIVNPDVFGSFTCLGAFGGYAIQALGDDCESDTFACCSRESIMDLDLTEMGCTQVMGDSGACTMAGLAVKISDSDIAGTDMTICCPSGAMGTRTCS